MTALAYTASEIARFWALVDQPCREEDCWLWQASRTPKGYGSFTIRRDGGRVTHMAHRVAYAISVSSIPADLEIDHLCENKSCVNPAHMDLVTRAEHNRRTAARKPAPTHCRNGHAYTPDNLRFTPNGRRQCLECRRISRLKERGALASVSGESTRQSIAVHEATPSQGAKAGATRLTVRSDARPPLAGACLLPTEAR